MLFLGVLAGGVWFLHRKSFLLLMVTAALKEGVFVCFFVLQSVVLGCFLGGFGYILVWVTSGGMFCLFWAKGCYSKCATAAY